MAAEWEIIAPGLRRVALPEGGWLYCCTVVGSDHVGLCYVPLPPNLAVCAVCGESFMLADQHP